MTPEDIPMDPSSWTQLNLHFGDPERVEDIEDIAVAHLAPALTTAESAGLLTGWFFIRKRPGWRLRYLTDAPDRARAHLQQHLDALQDNQQVLDVTESLYEPESRAFGGPEAMAIAHRLWHLDSRHLLAHLAATSHTATSHAPSGSRRRELALLLCAGMLRAADLDWYEQGDVWSRVAAHRHPPSDTHQDALTFAVRRLISVDTAELTSPEKPLATILDWLNAYTNAGENLSRLNLAGRLHRGLRDSLAHHIIFAWNRAGLPASTQSLLAATAAVIIFDTDPRDPDHRAITSGTATVRTKP